MTKYSTRQDSVLDKTKIDSLVAWNEVIGSITANEKEKLIIFGEKYGEEAMLRRGETLYLEKKSSDPGILAKLRTRIEFLSGMQKIWSATPSKRKVSREIAIKTKKREVFVTGFAKKIEPIVRILSPLALHHLVFERWLMSSELSSWDDKLRNVNDLRILKQIIEARSGEKFEVLVKDVSRRVEQDIFEMWSANIEDGRTLANNPDLLKEYSAAISSRDLAALTKFYMKGNAQNV